MVVIFLPFPDIKRSIETLDDQRLGKQRVEAKQIYDGLIDDTYSWSKHPACKMFICPVSNKKYTSFVKAYYNMTLSVWESRGKNNNMSFIEQDEDEEIEYPWFWKWREFHYSHQASLIRKHPYYYYSIFPKLKLKYLDYGYIWPSKVDFSEFEKNKQYKNTGKWSWFNKSNFAVINPETSKNKQKSFERLYNLPFLKKIYCENYEGKCSLKKTELVNFLVENNLLEIPKHSLIEKVLF